MPQRSAKACHFICCKLPIGRASQSGGSTWVSVPFSFFFLVWGGDKCKVEAKKPVSGLTNRVQLLNSDSPERCWPEGSLPTSHMKPQLVPGLKVKVNQTRGFLSPSPSPAQIGRCGSIDVLKRRPFRGGRALGVTGIAPRIRFDGR